MKREEERSRRQEKIRELLEETSSMKVAELAEELKVTPETIRKDLDALESQGIIVREHGRARIQSAVRELSIETRSLIQPEQKRKIMQQAIFQIKDGMTVFLDGGTTVLSGLQMLRSKKDLHIVCCSLVVALECSQMGFRVTILGGDINPAGRNSMGPIAMQEIEYFHFDLAILGIAGFQGEQGFSLYQEDELFLYKRVIANSSSFIIVLPSDRKQKPGNYVFVKYEDVPLLITDRIPEEYKAEAEKIQRIITVE